MELLAMAVSCSATARDALTKISILASEDIARCDLIQDGKKIHAIAYARQRLFLFNSSSF
jgi:hypothetical protein